MIMGDSCTRTCSFCAVDHGEPEPLDAEEPSRLAEAVERMGLEHVVVTTVTRDDLPDGGAAHFVAVIEAVRGRVPDTAVEILTSDFGGDLDAVDAVVAAGPDVFNHNIETVPRLYPRIRPEADYGRSLAVLERVHEGGAHSQGRERAIPAKSGLMLGLGETYEEVAGVMQDLRDVGCSMLTLGQYLRPSAAHVPVSDFVAPEVFAELARLGYSLGFDSIASAPLVRSSYRAHELAQAASCQSATGSGAL
jgi:lipoic acid synthetase